MTERLADLRRRSRHGTLLLVSMMKDEAPFLLEWVAHHLAVGFTDLLVYTNDCSDGTVEMLQRLAGLGLCHHRENVMRPGQKPQPSAIRHAQDEALVAAADWVMLLDADEFLCLSHPTAHLDGLLDDTTARGANGLVVTWRIFGSNGIRHWQPAPVTEQYIRAAPADWNKGWGVKTLFRFDPDHWKLGIHRPSIRNRHLDTGFPDTVRWLNGSGEPMEDYFRFRGWRSIRRTVGYDWAQVNHYAVKSAESYLARKLRGNVNNKADKYNADYWALQDRNEVEDRTALRHAPRRAEIMAALLEDDALRDLHAAAQARIEGWLVQQRGTPEHEQALMRLAAASEQPIGSVTATPPKPRDPARIAARMSDVERRTAAQPRERRRTPVPGPHPPDACLTGEAPWIDNQGIELPADPGLFTPAALVAVAAGRFERRAARAISGDIGQAPSLLDAGPGLGFVAMRAARMRPDLRVSIVVPDKGLRAAVAAIAERNDLAHRLRLLPAPEPGLAAGLRLSAEAVVWLARLDLAPVERVLLPFRDAADADALRREYGSVLAESGLVEGPSRPAALLFLRVDASPAPPGED